MKTAKSIVVFCVALSGCASVIPYTAEQQCALQGMKLRGVSVGASSGTGYVTGGGVAVMDSHYYGVDCAVTKEPAEVCDISATQEALQPEVDYNSTIGLKRGVTGVAYVFYVLPGLFFKLVFDHYYDSAVAQSSELAKVSHAKCHPVEVH